MKSPPVPAACHMALTSLSLCLADALLRTDNSVAGAALLILGTSALHLARRVVPLTRMAYQKDID
ncbi:hypothetical protein [Paraburkholderia nodosa]|uniref:hypothetical protein n=1 Tax=Paraburkholderia nodosa TaxID=392320 RepID=UPI0004836E3F|nr:hypothetical protein [Paraburkholderia nodosa]